MPCRFIDGIYPKVVSRGYQGKLVDVDGNEYIDLISGLGAISLGYSNSQVNQKVIDQLYKGVSFSLPTELEYLVAKKLIELVPNTEMWKFGKNGTDGTVMAVRAARAFTGRTKILTVGYNGCADQFEIRGTRTAGIPKELSTTIDKAEYNNIFTFHKILDGEYACVLMEPMVYEYPAANFLETIREWCSMSGTLLIFDEVVTGGRFKDFVAQKSFGIIPDITVLGKAIANGFPLSAVGAKRSIMETFERDDFFASNTFGGEAVSLAACLETLNQLPMHLPQMYIKGLTIKEKFNALFFERLNTKCIGYPTRLVFQFPTVEHKALFMQEMCLEGVLIGAANMVMASHTFQDVEDIQMAMFKASQVVKNHWAIPIEALYGKLPTDALRKN